MLNGELENKLKETLCKIEDAKFLLEDGKTIQAYNKLLGIRQKLSVIYSQVINENT